MVSKRRTFAACCAGIAWSAAHAAGPDVIVGELPDVDRYGPIGQVHAYSVATTACNIGDAELEWIDDTNRHPLIAQNMYRLSDGRIEQIGMSWLKHGFGSLQQSACDTCSSLCGAFCNLDGLLPGCSDPYTSSLNGQQTRLGPRFEVNPSSGAYAWPYTFQGDTGDAIFKRIQVHEDDLTVPDALYFVEGQYMAPDDAEAGNNNNNASYRRVTIGTSFSVTMRGGTARESPAIFAWRDHGGGVDTPDPDVVLTPIDVPDDGRFWIGAKATDNGDGTWRYEYAVHNLNSHRSAGAVSVPLPDGTTASNVGFHHVPYHSGEPFSAAAWLATTTATAIRWASPETFDVNPDSNALRWGTMYNVRFDADAPPADGLMTLELFRPGTPTSVSATIPVPSGPTCPCETDGMAGVTVSDLLVFLGVWFTQEGTTVPVGTGADYDANGDVNVADLLGFLTCWFSASDGAACP